MFINSVNDFIYLYESEPWRLTSNPNISNRAEFLEFSPNIIGWQKKEEKEELEEIEKVEGIVKIEEIEECYYEWLRMLRLMIGCYVIRCDVRCVLVLIMYNTIVHETRWDDMSETCFYDNPCYQLTVHLNRVFVSWI